MQQITLYFWRVQDPRTGKWYTTPHRATEADIRREHPEAECMPAESLTLDLPETPEDLAQRLRVERIHYPTTPGMGG
ncbi:hypothetical protein CCO03_13550 [Comamonas serinivorans]|uniref:Uncharacterized protein n=1 Tax=Comamonas serinivorans TaxID=1082851 RepID=A0A1Y0EQ95_9BURK|nr:hypothetical protein [Comamonas serinivorans]ARU05571.1 hypothetical protein CCO03_13550 [Comamonas serinivorans]